MDLESTIEIYNCRALDSLPFRRYLQDDPDNHLRYDSRAGGQRAPNKGTLISLVSAGRMFAVCVLKKKSSIMKRPLDSQRRVASCVLSWLPGYGLIINPVRETTVKLIIEGHVLEIWKWKRRLLI